MRRGLEGLLFAAVLVGLPAVAAAQDRAVAGDDDGEELVPSPEEHPPSLAGEVHGDLVLPLYNDPICPAGALCILGNGGGLGGTLERRWPKGYALGLGYDAWFLDPNGVYEITVVQMVRAEVRHFFMRDNVMHPFLGGSIGALVLGESFKVATLGGALELTGGVEIELTKTLGLVFASAWRAFLTTPFVTANDEVARAKRRVPNLMMTIRAGLTIQEGP